MDKIDDQKNKQMVFDLFEKGATVEHLIKKTSFTAATLYRYKKEYDSTYQKLELQKKVLDHLSENFSEHAKVCCSLSLKLMRVIDSMVDEISEKGQVTKDQKEVLEFIGNGINYLTKAAKIINIVPVDMKDTAIDRLLLQQINIHNK